MILIYYSMSTNYKYNKIELFLHIVICRNKVFVEELGRVSGKSYLWNKMIFFFYRQCVCYLYEFVWQISEFVRQQLMRNKQPKSQSLKIRFISTSEFRNWTRGIRLFRKFRHMYSITVITYSPSLQEKINNKAG